MNRWSNPMALRSKRCALLIAALVMVISIGLTRGGPDQAARGHLYTLPPNLLIYFQEKYVDVDDFLISTIQETPDGPLGHINVRGRLAPGIEIEAETREERARAAAWALIENEAELLDIKDLSEIREMDYKTISNGDAVFQYQRFIGEVTLLWVSIRVDVGPDDRITRFYANLVPVSREVYEAEKRENLDEDEIIRIVTEDLTPPAQEAISNPTYAEQKTPVRIVNARKLADWRPPYIIWGVAARKGVKPPWSYTIDAFTGEILKKSCTAHGIIKQTGGTLCD